MSKTAWVNRENYEAWVNGEEGAQPPFLWEKESRHADMALVPLLQPSEPVGCVTSHGLRLLADGDQTDLYPIGEKTSDDSFVYLNPPTREREALSIEKAAEIIWDTWEEHTANPDVGATPWPDAPREARQACLAVAGAVKDAILGDDCGCRAFAPTLGERVEKVMGDNCKVWHGNMEGGEDER